MTLARRELDAPLAVPERDFDTVVEEARKKAATLRKIVKDCGLARKIGESEHLEVEAWQTIGKGYGYTPKIEWTHRVEGGGWEARAVVLDAAGQEVSAAEGESGTEGDDNWVNKPSFQQRSMAQTRAVSKALRTCLSWVVVLAGYKATPAEEMDGVSVAKGAAPQQNRPHWCATDGVAWTRKEKDGKVWYSHRRADGTWCNEPSDKEKADSLYGDTPEEGQEEPAPEATPEARPAASANVVRPGDTPAAPPKNLGDLLNWAAAYGRGLKPPINLGRAEVAKACAVSDLAHLTDLGQAQQQVVAVYGPK